MSRFVSPPRMIGMNQITHSAAMVFLFDGVFFHLPGCPWRIAARHDRQTMSNLLFFDGHVEPYPSNNLPTDFTSLSALANYPFPLWRLDQQ